MRFLNKSTIAVVFGVVFANTANAAAFNVTSDQDNITIIGTQGAGYDLDLMANKVITNQNDITGLKTENTDQWNAISAADNLAGSAKTDAQTANTNALAADAKATTAKEGANKQVISSQADSLIKISRIWADFFPANTSNQPI